MDETEADALVVRLVEIYRAEGPEAASELFAREARDLKSWEVRAVRGRFQREIEARLCHIIVIRGDLGWVRYCTSSPVTLKEAAHLLSKFTRRGKGLLVTEPTDGKEAPPRRREATQKERKLWEKTAGRHTLS